MMSRAEQELDREYTLARRSLFAVLSLLIGCMLFGLFDLSQPGVPASEEQTALGHSVLGVLFVFLAAYLAFPQLSNHEN